MESGTHPTVTDDAEALVLLIRDSPGALLVDDRVGEIVGTVIAGWNGWRGSIYRLAVVPSWRRRGVARGLLGVATTQLRAVGARRTDAFVVGDDAQARAFWDSLAPGWGLDPLDKVRYIHM